MFMKIKFDFNFEVLYCQIIEVVHDRNCQFNYGAIV